MSLINMKQMTKQISLIDEIGHAHYLTDTQVLTEAEPLFLIGNVTRNWAKENTNHPCPVYFRTTIYNCFVIHHKDTDGDTFDDINKKVLDEIRLMLAGCFLQPTIDYTLGNFEITREEIGDMDARVFNFQIILTEMKDYL